MLMCDKTITIIKQDGTFCVIKGASWYDKHKIATQDSGLVEANTTVIRIPAAVVPKGIEIERGDYVVLGAASWGDSLRKTLEANEHRKITSIGDNRRGRNPHLAVTAV